MNDKPLHTLSNEELWELFPIILSEYLQCWPERYRAEEKRLAATAGAKNIYRISHIGSTSVPGLSAKPTIDILLEIYHGVNLDFLTRNIEKAGYLYSSQPDNPTPHMMFMKGYTPKGFEGQAYHVHVRYPGDWDELYFRDYLKEYQETAAEYSELKSELKSRFEHDRDGYTSAKTDFIRRVTDLARQKYKGRYEY